MGVLHSLNIGTTALQAHGDNMGIIGDNIANASTNAFKIFKGGISRCSKHFHQWR